MTQQFSLETDVQYGEGGGVPLFLDILRPQASGDAPRPAIVYVHGGGWLEGDRSSGYVPNLMLARLGFFTITISYRFSQVAPFPAQIHDVKAAIRFLRAHAGAFNIDPERIGVWGHSAGGHLAAMAGLHTDITELEGESGSPEYSSNVQAVVPISSPTDFTTPWLDLNGNALEESGFGPITQLMGGSLESRPDLVRLASPAVLVQTGDAPSLILHGTIDDVVPFHQAELLVDAMKRAGNEVTLIPMAGVNHGAQSPMLPGNDDPFGTRDAVVEFFTRHLGPVSPQG